MGEYWNEKSPLVSEQRQTNRSRRNYLGSLTFLVILSCLWISTSYRAIPRWRSHSEQAPRCAQVEPLTPERTTKRLDNAQKYLNTETFRNISIARLSGAVQIPTESFDDMGAIGSDPRWDIFYSFADYLSKTFPLVHQKLQLEKVNTHGLLYTWPGTNPKLKPNMLMAHQDVVPVLDSTVKQWTHPPFSGEYDGTFVWGRGASDCKNQLIGVLSAVEALLAADFRPQRTLILSFGFDEEVKGYQGAGHLAEHLLLKHGKDSIAAIIDEGAVNVESWGADFAIPGVAEKGYVDVDVTVRMPGGHSSIPPVHNGIGVASEFITLLEANIYDPELAEENPYLDMLHCGAEHAPEFPSPLKKLLGKRSAPSMRYFRTSSKDELALEAAKAGPAIKYLFTTSSAVDIIHGGVKNNALPERTQFLVNHRTNVGSNSSAIKAHMTALAAQIAQKYNLTLHAFNGTETPNSITLSARPVLEPAPITPTSQDLSDNARKLPFIILSGTTRALYGKELIVSPGLMTGNTDTKYVHALSKHIFRYGPGWDKEQNGLGNIHTVNEKVGVRAHLDTIKWMWLWIRNMDEADL